MSTSSKQVNTGRQFFGKIKIPHVKFPMFANILAYIVWSNKCQQQQWIYTKSSEGLP